MHKKKCSQKQRYFLSPTTDYLGDWSEWTPCIARGSSCGGTGQQARFKYCDYPDTSKWQEKEKKIYEKRNPNKKRCPDGFKKSETRSCAAPPIACCSVSVKVTDAITRRPVQGANVSFTISGETGMVLLSQMHFSSQPERPELSNGRSNFQIQ